MRTLMFFCGLMLLSTGSDAFERVIGGAAMDRGVFVEPTRDGGYVVVGVTANTAEGDEDMYLVKLDSDGQMEWSQTHGGDDEDNGWCVRELANGYAIAGFTKSLGVGGYDGNLIRTDADGEILWSKTYGGATDDRLWGMITTSDGGFAMVGEIMIADQDAQDVWLLKTDAAGNEEWSRHYGGMAADRGFALVQMEAGGYVLVGQTYSEGAGDRDAYVIHVDDQGTLIWSRTFGGKLSDVGHGVDHTSDGNILVTGYTTSLATSGDDPFLIELDSAGNTVWTRVLDVPGISRTITGVQSPAGGFYLTGFTHNPLTRDSAALLIHTDDRGAMVWSRKLLSTSAGQSFGYTVRATDGGGCVLTGHTTVGSAGDLDLFVIRIDPEADQ